MIQIKHVMVATMVFLSSRCTETNPKMCTTDEQCRDPSFAGYVGSNKPYCHTKAGICHMGCTDNDYCQRKNYTGRPLDPVEAAKESWCNPATKMCEREPKNNAKGLPCTLSSQCHEGLTCVDNVCCSSGCKGDCVVCNSVGKEGECVNAKKGTDPRGTCKGTDALCNGSCDGNGQCAFPGQEVVCKDAECTNNTGSDSMLRTFTCNGAGKCSEKDASCGGYTCQTKSSCKTSCSSKADCSSRFSCESSICYGSLDFGEKCGSNHNACASRHCIDGVCCKTTCEGRCESCNMLNKAGTCSAAEGLVSAKDCPGDSECGPGTCDANKNCVYKGLGKACKSDLWSCASGNETIYTCDAAHLCKQSKKTCSPHLCNGAQTACLQGCQDSAECVAGSVCDRTEAHKKGLGTCVDPAKVVTVSKTGPHTTITDGLAALENGKTHLRMEAGTYDAVKIDNKKGIIIGVGKVIIQGNEGNDGVTVENNSTITLQGVTLTSSPSTASSGKSGINCNSSKLKVIEGTIESNKKQGIEASECDVTIRRSIIKANKEGGAKLSDGTVTIVNSLIVKNGTATSKLGGIMLVSPDPVIFVNNTVVDNEADTNYAGGVKCDGAFNLVNSIFWGNKGSNVQVGKDCVPQYSDVQGGASGLGNINQDPTFDQYRPRQTACFNAGDNSAITALSTLDLANKARVSKTQVDMGAYEID